MRLVRLVGLSTIFGLLLLVIAPVSALAPHGPTLDLVESFPTANNLPDPNAIFDLVNAQREKHGLKPLTKSAALSKAAQQRAVDMQTNNYYAHQGSDGRFFDDLLDSSLYSQSYACENLDLQFSVQPNRYVNDWLGSRSGHKECLLNADVASAGYAVVEVAPTNGADVSAFIVVAIHAAN